MAIKIWKWVLGKGYHRCQKPEEQRAWNEESQQYNRKGLQVVPHGPIRCWGSDLADARSTEALTLLSCFRSTHQVYTDKQENRRIEPSRYSLRGKQCNLNILNTKWQKTRSIRHSLKRHRFEMPRGNLCTRRVLLNSFH